MSSQRQKGGDNSTNVQAQTIIVRQGPSLEEVRQIALDVYKSNFLELADVAKDIALQRAEEITDKFLRQMQQEHPDGIRQAREPGFQTALYTVQKEYASCGDKELGDLLVDLLVDRTKHESRSLIQIVLNESLAVAPKLTPDQLAALSVILALTYSADRSIRDHQSLWSYLDQYVAPFERLISDKASCYQHLEYAGCGAVNLGSRDLERILERDYGGLFSNGFDEIQFEEKQLTVPLSHPVFRACLNDSTRFEVNVIKEGVIHSECDRLKLSHEDATKIMSLHRAVRMNSDEIRRRIIDGRPYMRRIFEIWEESSMKQFTLTSVGIAIGHANIRKNVGEFGDLAIWIN